MDVGRLGLAALVVPAPLPAWRVPVSSGQLLPACRLSWEQGGQLAALWTSDERDLHRGFLLRVALLDVEGLTVLEHTLPDAPDTRHPDVAAIFPAASRMQRAAFDLVGTASDADDQRPWAWMASWPIDQFPLRRDFVPSPKWEPGQEEYPFIRVEGEGVHEIPVGPIHAGIIEPGHFRFSCLGEVITNLEIRLGYQHRGVERRLTELPWPQTRFVAEAASSDTAVGNALAHSVALE